MTINFDTLFARVGHWCEVAHNLDDTAAATLVTDVRAAEEDLDTEQHDFQQDVLGSLESLLDSNLSSIGSIMTQLAGTPIQNLIVETVHADTPLVNKTLTEALAVLIEQMEDESESLDASTITTSNDYGENSSSSGSGDNYGNGVLVCCTKRGDGQVNQFIVSETLRCEITGTNASGQATWTVKGEPSEALTHPDWPGGSGTNRSITSYVGGQLCPNGDFEDADTYATALPDDWILSVGTLSTHLRLTSIETQTVTINGTPTGGWYTLTFNDRDGNDHTTVPLTYRASASALQSALRDLPGLSEVTVSATGTSPNYTHTVVFTGVPNPSPLTYTSGLTGGSPTITVATATAGSAYVTRGARALEFIGNGSTLTTIQVPVSLSKNTCYCLNLWAAVDVTPAAGVLTVDLIEGIGEAVLTDDEGNNNSFTVDCTGLTASPAAQNGCFHTPLNMPDRIYLRLRLTTALSAGSSLFVDECCLVAMTELYRGGLFMAAFSGPNDYHLEDYAEVTVANDRAGSLHEWLHRFLDLGGKQILFPVTDPTGTQTDALIT